jgi:hypothetical protein
MVGTYLQKNTFAVLLYPIMTGDLEKFLEEERPKYEQWFGPLSSRNFRTQKDLACFFFLLTHALSICMISA